MTDNTPLKRQWIRSTYDRLDQHQEPAASRLRLAGVTSGDINYYPNFDNGSGGMSYLRNITMDSYDSNMGGHPVHGVGGGQMNSMELAAMMRPASLSSFGRNVIDMRGNLRMQPQIRNDDLGMLLQTPQVQLSNPYGLLPQRARPNNCIRPMTYTSPASFQDDRNNRNMLLSQEILRQSNGMLLDRYTARTHLPSQSHQEEIALMLLLQQKKQLQQQHELQHELQHNARNRLVNMALEHNKSSEQQVASNIVATRYLDGDNLENSPRPLKCKKWKKPKDKPKRPLSAYNAFFREERADILARLQSEAPEESKKAARISFEDLGKKIGKRWRELPADKLDYYKDIAQNDTLRYQRELQLWNEKKERKKSSDLNTVQKCVVSMQKSA